MLSTLWRHIKTHPIRTAALFGVVAGAINVLVLEIGGIAGRNTSAVLRMLLPSTSSDAGVGGAHALQAAFLLLFEVTVNVLVYVLMFVIPVAIIVAIRRRFVGMPVLDASPERLQQVEFGRIQSLGSPCAGCGKQRLEQGDGHQYALLASEIATKGSLELSRFFRLYEERNWTELSLIHRFDGRFNAALIYAVRCHAGTTILVVRDPVELYDSDSLLDVIVLDPEQTAVVDALPITFKQI